MKKTLKEEDTSIFTAAFLDVVRKAHQTREVQTFMKWVIKPRRSGVGVRLKGVEKTLHFFPNRIFST